MAEEIAGYRVLSVEEIAQINRIKRLASEVGEMIEEMGEADGRWLAIGRTDLQKGFMALTRAVAKPEGF